MNSRRNPPKPRSKPAADAIYRTVWETSLDACFLLHPERDATGEIVDFIFDDVNPRGAAALGRQRDALLGKHLRRVVPIGRFSPLFKRYVSVVETGRVVDEEFELNVAEISARWVRQQVMPTPNGIAIVARNISKRKTDEHDNHQNRVFLQTLVDHLPLLIFAKSVRPDTFGEIAVWNRAAERITGLTEREVLGHSFGDSLAQDLDAPAEVDLEVPDDGAPVQRIHSFLRRDGSVRSLRTRLLSMPDEYGTAEYILGIAEDVTDFHAAQEQLRLASKVFEYTTETIIVSDAQDRILTVNAAFSALTGFSKADVVGHAAADYETIGDATIEPAKFLDEVVKSGFWTGPGAQRRKSGGTFPCWRNVACVRDEAGRVVNFVRIATDITVIEQAQAQLEKLANDDALTGLPNRRLFNDRLAHALKRAARSQQQLALLFIDLDNFKLVNDTLGHDVGDLVLKEFSARLAACAREGDTVCRLGGDEFTVIMENVGQKHDARLVAQRIIDTLRQPFVIGEHTITSTASVGISVYPVDGTEPQLLLRHADKALYRAKEMGGRYQFFTDTLIGETVPRLGIEAELRIAIEQQQLFLVYQPIVHLTTGRVTGFEALVRWKHPKDGTRLPNDFIPGAEATGLIVPLGEWVLRRACADMQRWQQEGLSDFNVSVNVSAYQFQRGNLLDTVERALGDYQIRPGRIELELTESAMLESLEAVKSSVRRLKMAGVSLCIDDFGTGYSSLVLLRRLAANTLKIDRTFIKDVPDDEGTVSIVRSILLLARALKMDVVAEGVETAAQLDSLKSLDCLRAQGYFFSRPVPPEEVPDLLDKTRWAPHKLFAVASR